MQPAAPRQGVSSQPGRMYHHSSVTTQCQATPLRPPPSLMVTDHNVNITSGENASGINGNTTTRGGTVRRHAFGPPDELTSLRVCGPYYQTKRHTRRTKGSQHQHITEVPTRKASRSVIKAVEDKVSVPSSQVKSIRTPFSPTST